MSDTEDKKSGASYEERVKHVSVIAQPLASKKQTKRAYKVVKKATKVKGIKRGVKEVVKSIRKGEKGVCLIAGDISPIDVISHIPVLCEENDIPYLFTPSKVCATYVCIIPNSTSTHGSLHVRRWTSVRPRSPSAPRAVY